MAPDIGRFRLGSRRARTKRIGGSPPSALLTRSKSWYGVASWRDHTTLGKLVVLAGWLGTMALMVGGALALVRGVKARETWTAMVALAVLGVAVLYGLATWGFTRFRPWAWRFVAAVYAVVAIAGVLVSVVAGDVRGIAAAAVGGAVLLALRALSDSYFPPPES